MSVVVLDSIKIDDDALAYFARLTSIGNNFKKSVNRFIVGVKNDNGLSRLSDAFEYMHIMGGVGSEANAKINVISSSYNFIAVNSPTWASTGYTGNGTTSYLNSQFTPSTNAVVLSQNDAFLGTYIRTNNQTGYSAGTLNAATTNAFNIIPRYTDDVFYIRNNNATGTFGSIANTDSRGFFVTQRIDSANIHQWKNGVNLKTTAATSTALSNVPIWHLANNFNNVIQLPSTSEQAFGCCGKATVINQAALYTRVQQLAVDLGFSV